MSDPVAEAEPAAERWVPTLPPGGPLELPGRGATFVRHQPAPPGAPTVLLLHGIRVTADANWFTSYPALTERYGVVAIDHRGHGRGIRSERAVRLSDCADDAAAARRLLKALQFRQRCQQRPAFAVSQPHIALAATDIGLKTEPALGAILDSPGFAVRHHRDAADGTEL